MKPEVLLEILAQAGKLKTTTRHCFTAPGRKESVADHSWRMALMALLLAQDPPYSSLNMNKVIAMCLIHDLGESFTGDIPTFVKTEQDRTEETFALTNWVQELPQAQRLLFTELFAEMEQKQTQEAKIYKALDRLEAVISHNESDLDTWLPQEYDLQYTYGAEDVKFSPQLTQLKTAIDAQTTAKIQAQRQGKDKI